VGKCGIIDLDFIIPMQQETILPIVALSGVRSSWLILAKKVLLALEAASALFKASCKAISALLPSAISMRSSLLVAVS